MTPFNSSQSQAVGLTDEMIADLVVVRSFPKELLASHSLISLEKEDIDTELRKLMVRRFSCGVEVAAFQAVVDRADLERELESLEGLHQAEGPLKFISRLCVALEALGVKWESVGLPTSTLLNFENVAFGVIPGSLEALVSNPEVWGREMIRRSEEGVMYAFNAAPAANAENWTVTLEEVGRERTQNKVGGPRVLSAEMTPERYSEFKASLASNVSTDAVVHKFQFA
jgi:hypothetical protein